MRIFFTAIALFLLAPTFPAFAAQPAVRIGVSLSLTGEFSAAGRKALAGLRMRVDDHNSRAGSGAPRITLVVRDDESNLDVALRNLEQLATADKVPAVIGPLPSNLMLSMKDTANRLGVVLLSPSVTSPRIGKDGDWAFRLLFDDEFQGVALARFLYRKQGVRTTAAIVNKRLAYANSITNAFHRVFEEEGGTIVAEEFYEWVADEDQDFDFSDVLQKVAAANPDFVLLPNNSVEVAAIIRQSYQEGVKARFCGGDTWLHENILLSAGFNVEGAFFVSGINYEADTPAMKRFLELYDNSHDPEALPSSVLGYDAMSLIIEALKTGHDAASVKEGLYKIKNFPLATGSITIDPQRGSEKSAYIHRIDDEDGEFVQSIIDVVNP